jgi:hypothetical protein
LLSRFDALDLSVSGGRRSKLINLLPDPSLDLDDDDRDDRPITIKGEPLSETTIREQR